MNRQRVLYATFNSVEKVANWLNGLIGDITYNENTSYQITRIEHFQVVRRGNGTIECLVLVEVSESCCYDIVVGVEANATLT